MCFYSWSPLVFWAQIHWVISSVSTAPSGIMRHPKAERGCRHSAAYPPCGHCDRRAMLWYAMLIYVDRPQEQGGIRCSVAAGCSSTEGATAITVDISWHAMTWDVRHLLEKHTHTHRVPRVQASSGLLSNGMGHPYRSDLGIYLQGFQGKPEWRRVL